MDSSIGRGENINASSAETNGCTASCNIGVRNVPTTEQDENQYMKQERMMEEIIEQTKQQSLTSQLLPLSTLKEQYMEHPNFITGLNILEKTYEHIRTIRGDGNCYYRAFLYSLLEYLVCTQQQQQRDDVTAANTTEAHRILHYVTTKSWEDILQQNYDEMAIEIFHDEMIDLFQQVIEKKTYNNDNLSTTFHNKMNEENSISDYCTWYLRLITATYIKQDPDRFLPFILSSSNEYDMILDIQQFCCKHIEPMGQECEHVQVLALAEAFQIYITVVYLDGRQPQQKASAASSTNNNLPRHSFGPETSSIRLTLLYRPGHYDILYEKIYD